MVEYTCAFAAPAVYAALAASAARRPIHADCLRRCFPWLRYLYNHHWWKASDWPLFGRAMRRL